MSRKNVFKEPSWHGRNLSRNRARKEDIIQGIELAKRKFSKNRFGKEEFCSKNRVGNEDFFLGTEFERKKIFKGTELTRKRFSRNRIGKKKMFKEPIWQGRIFPRNQVGNFIFQGTEFERKMFPRDQVDNNF